MNGNVTIRLAEARDAGTIHAGLLALARSMGAEAKIQSTPADIAAHGFGAVPTFEVLLAEIDGAFAGFCLTFPSFSTWRGESGIYVQDLFVEEAFRGLRIGERLLRSAARRGRDHGAAYLSLSVNIDNTGAQAFYTRLGVVHVNDEQIHMIKGDAFDIFTETEVDRP